MEAPVSRGVDPTLKRILQELQSLRTEVKDTNIKVDVVLSFLQQTPGGSKIDVSANAVKPQYNHVSGMSHDKPSAPPAVSSMLHEPPVRGPRDPAPVCDPSSTDSDSSSEEEEDDEEEEEEEEPQVVSLAKRTTVAPISRPLPDPGASTQAPVPTPATIHSSDSSITSSPISTQPLPTVPSRSKVNFGECLPAPRPTSPLPRRREKITIFDTAFKSTRTDRFHDNRHDYFSKMMEIVPVADPGNQSPRTGDRQENQPQGVSKEPVVITNHVTMSSSPRTDTQSTASTSQSFATTSSNSSSRMTPSPRSTAERIIPDSQPQRLSVLQPRNVHSSLSAAPGGNDTSYSEFDSSTDSMSNQQNNQTLTDSGLKNNHGPEDNRNVWEAHEDSMDQSHHYMRSSDLHSNYLRFDSSKPVRNGVSSPVTSATATDDGASEKDHEDVEDEEDEEEDEDDMIERLIERQRKEAKHCLDSKSEAMDTVICLDTSESMSKTKEQAIKCIMSLIDGLEQNVIEHDLEENVALVTFGLENTIVQHLTNDYDKIRDVLETVQYGGSSPMFVGLALALTEIEQRGGQCGMTDHSVLPRIILISDGFATDITGPESLVPNSEVDEKIESLVKNNLQTVDGISCVFLLKFNKDCLETIAKESGGRLVPASKMHNLCIFFRIHTMVNTVMSQLKDVLREMSPDDVRRNIRNILSTADMEETEEVFEVINNRYDERPPLKFGERVELVPQAQSDDLNIRDEIGTVLRTSKGKVKVLWDSGVQTRNAKAELRKVDKPRRLKEKEHIQVGIRVIRGPDWKTDYDKHDGGPAEFGLAVKIDDKIVHVIWPNSNSGNYRYGYCKKYDIRICKGQMEMEEWLYQNTEGQWMKFSTTDTDTIKKVKQSKPKSTVLVTLDGIQYRIILSQRLAKNMTDPSLPDLKVKDQLVVV